MGLNRQQRRNLERTQKIKLIADIEARKHIEALAKEIVMIKSIMQKQWPQYFVRRTDGGVIAPDGIDLSKLKGEKP